jgi:hypothetical protein
MNGTESIREFARVGVRQKLAEIQTTLESIYQDFPEEFTSKPLVVMNGHSTPAPVNGHGPAPAPPRRVKVKVKRRPKLSTKPSSVALVHKDAIAKPWGTLAWQRIHDYLAAQPKMKARAAEIRKAVKVSDPVVYSIVDKRPDLFFRAEPGVFALKARANKA